MSIAIRVLRGLGEFEATVEVQREVWGFSDVDLVAPRLFAVATHIGGLVLGASEGPRLVGFSLAFPGVKPGGQAYWHSHMTGVLPTYQNRGVGRLIKLEQRRQALQAGIERVEWTFDPLEIRNAHFNIARLGVTVGHYIPNQYGVTSSRLHGGLPTDRLVAEWDVGSPRVNALIDRGESVEELVEATIEVPAGIESLRQSDVERARAIQTRVREQFSEHLRAGLVVVGYQRTEAGGVFQFGRLQQARAGSAERPRRAAPPGGG